MNARLSSTRESTIVNNPLRTVANRIADTKHKNKTNDIIIKNNTTNIPNNLPVAVIGDKGSGKSTLITALMKATHEESIFENIFFVYSSLTLDLDLPSYVTKIDINNCDTFLANFFEIKSIYNSYIKFFDRVSSEKILQKIDKSITEEQASRYLTKILDCADNEIQKYNQQIINSGIDNRIKIDKLIDTGEKIITKFSHDFYIDNIKINGLKRDERDLIVIDDIAIAAKILFRQIKDNPLYEYLTLTRHMRISVVFAGQQVEQIPKTIRREVCCWLLSRNSNVELLQGVLTKRILEQIQAKQIELQKYEFVIYNTDSGYLGIL